MKDGAKQPTINVPDRVPSFDKQVEENFHLLRAILQKISDSVIVVDTSFKMIYVNQATEKMFGYPREELLGKGPEIFNADPDKENIHEAIGQAIGSGDPWTGTILSRRKDGTTFFNSCQISPIYNEKGHRIGAIGIRRDITERQELEKEQVILNTALDGFWIASLEGKLLEVNDSYCTMMGYTREELLNMSIQNVEAVESPEDVVRHVKKVIEQGSDHFETRQKRKDGKIIDIEVNTHRLDMEKGQISVFLRDITERKQAEQRQKTLSRYISSRPATQLQKRFIKEGFQYFEDRQIIGLLLSLVLPPGKANRLAGECIQKFKNLRDFLAASPGELQQIGISPSCLFTIKLLHELPARVLQEKIKLQSVYKSSRAVFDYLYYSMQDLKKEVFKVIYLDSQNRIIDTNDLFEGTGDIIRVRPRYVVKNAIINGATGLIFVHNHPSGDPAPSRSDKQLTRDLVFVGYILQIKVLDHIIIGQGRYSSFADEGLIAKYEEEFLNFKIKGLHTPRAFRRV